MAEKPALDHVCSERDPGLVGPLTAALSGHHGDGGRGQSPGTLYICLPDAGLICALSKRNPGEVRVIIKLSYKTNKMIRQKSAWSPARDRHWTGALPGGCLEVIVQMECAWGISVPCELGSAGSRAVQTGLCALGPGDLKGARVGDGFVPQKH